MANQLSHTIDIQVMGLLTKIGGGAVDEDAVRSLYGHVRQYAAKDGFTRDIADFFAHPLKNRERIRKHVRRSVRDLRAWESVVRRGEVSEDKRPKISGIAHTTIMADLNSELKALDQLPLEGQHYHRVALVLMSALGGTSIAMDSGEPVTLHFFCFPDRGVKVVGWLPFAGGPVPTGEPGCMFEIVSMPNVFGLLPFHMRPDDPGRSIMRVTFECGNVIQVQEMLAQRFEFQAGAAVQGGARTVMPGIPMIQPLAVKPWGGSR